MEILTDNMYKNILDRNSQIFKTVHSKINERSQVLLFDFDQFLKNEDVLKSIYYIHTDSLPSYVVRKFVDRIPICIKHLRLIVVSFV